MKLQQTSKSGEAIMELKEAISTRRTVRDFKNEAIPEEVIHYAIENGFKAPSYNHLRDWDFIIIRNDETKQQLIAAEHLEKEADMEMLKIKFAKEDPIMKKMYLDAIPKQKRMILEAPTVVVVVFKPKVRMDKAQRVYDLNCLASVWACIENFLLSLAEHHVFGVTYIPQHTEEVRKNLGVPEAFEIAAVIPVGYQADQANIIEQKPVNMKARIHSEKW